jgi:hypothetical protein
MCVTKTTPLEDEVLSSLLFISFAMAMPQPTLDHLLSEQGWTPLKTIQDKSVGTIIVQQKDIAGFPCFRAKGTSTVSVEVFGIVAQDIPSSLKWSSSGLKESISLVQSPTQIDYYQYLSITFFADRHWFLRAQIKRSEKQFRFIWKPIPAGEHLRFIEQKKSEYPNTVEPPINIGEWKFTENSAGKVLVQYSICTHPGGSIPKQFRSIGTVKTLPTNVKEMILEGRKNAQ